MATAFIFIPYGVVILRLNSSNYIKALQFAVASLSHVGSFLGTVSKSKYKDAIFRVCRELDALIKALITDERNSKKKD